MRRIKGVVVILPALVVTIAVVMSQGQNQGEGQVKDNYPHVKFPSGTSPEKEKSFKERLNRMPLGDYNAPEAAEPQVRAKRLNKSKSYNNRRGRGAGQLGWVELAVMNNDWHFALESSRPVSQSSAVIVGEVTETRSLVSEDKSRAYSEFDVRVEEVLKNDSSEPIAVGDQIITERLGGRIKFREGQVSTYTVAGQGMPEPGKKYVIFLGYNRREAGSRSPQEMNRHILTAYELRKNKVFLLDSYGFEHEGKDVTSFLSETKRTAEDSPQPQPQ